MKTHVRSLPYSSSLIARLMVLVVLAAFHSKTAEARDLSGRLGLGFNNQFMPSQSAGPGAISFRYALARDLGTELVLGVDTEGDRSTIAGLKLMKNVFLETNLNFYFALGVGYAQSQGDSGIEFLGTFGTQFFIPGLESIGFSTEAGFAGDTVGGGMSFRTLGVSFVNAGIHFYL